MFFGHSASQARVCAVTKSLIHPFWKPWLLHGEAAFLLFLEEVDASWLTLMKGTAWPNRFLQATAQIPQPIR